MPEERELNYWYHIHYFVRLGMDIRQELRLGIPPTESVTINTDKPFLEVEDWAHDNCPQHYEVASIEKLFATVDMAREGDYTKV